MFTYSINAQDFNYSCDYNILEIKRTVKDGLKEWETF